MRSIDKINGKRESTNLPFSIGLILKIAVVVAGFCGWGVDFIWVVLAWYFCRGIIKWVGSCLITLIALTGFIWFLITHIF